MASSPAGHEEEVGEYQRGAAAQDVGNPAGREDGHEHVHVHGAGSSTAQAIGGENAREKEAPSLTSTTPPPERVHSDTVPQLQNDNV